MSESPKTNLEYSKYDEPTPELDAADQKIEIIILEAHRDIERFTAKIEEIRLDPEYTDEERSEDTQHYNKLIESNKEIIARANETLLLGSMIKKVNAESKKQTDEILKKGEDLDPLTADVTNEYRNPHKIN